MRLERGLDCRQEVGLVGADDACARRVSSRGQPPSLGRKAILPLRQMKVPGIDGGNVPGFC